MRLLITLRYVMAEECCEASPLLVIIAEMPIIKEAI